MHVYPLGFTRLSLAGLLICLSGCAFPGLDRVQGPKQFDGLNKRMEADYLETDKVVPQAFADYANPKNDPETKRSKRNEIVSGLIAIDDYSFQMYSANAAYLQRGTATVADVTVLALTSAAAVTGGEEAKSVLAGLAAVITGSKVVVDRDVFYSSTLPVLLGRMQALRQTKRSEILAKFSKSDADYPLNEAISDVYDYYQDGTLSAAIADISNDTAKMTAQPTIKDEIEKFAKSYTGTLTLDATPFTVADASWDDASQTLTLYLKNTNGAAKPANAIDGSPTSSNATNVSTTLRGNSTAFEAMTSAAQGAILAAHLKLVDAVGASPTFFK